MPHATFLLLILLKHSPEKLQTFIHKYLGTKSIPGYFNNMKRRLNTGVLKYLPR